MVGRTPVWTGKGHRTPAGHKLALSVNAGLEEHGWARGDRKAVDRVIAELLPTYRPRKFGALRQAYYEAERLPPPLATEEDRWMSLLIQWGKEPKRYPANLSAEQARSIVNRLIEAAGPSRRVVIDPLFVKMNERIHYNCNQKIEWLRNETARMARNPLYFPIPAWQHGRPDVIAGKIETYLANKKRAHKRDIAANLKILSTTCQNTLVSLRRAGRIVRVAAGVYALPTADSRNYIPGGIAVLDALATERPSTCAELRDRTGLSEGAVHAALHNLTTELGKIIRVKRGVYALQGAVPHVYARDAVIEELRRGRNTISELAAKTGKNRGELTQAVYRLKSKGLVTRHFVPGRSGGLRGRGGHRGPVAAFALSKSGKRAADRAPHL
jgi:predicted transcriptional regulator